MHDITVSVEGCVCKARQSACYAYFDADGHFSQNGTQLVPGSLSAVSGAPEAV